MPDCPLCLDPLTNGLTVRTPCGHFYHRNCLIEQLRSQGPNWQGCGLCRTDFRAATLGTLEDQLTATVANLVVVSIPGMGLGAELSDTDLQ
ncbi:RING finger domain-containing protein [Paraburkholderia sp. J67]|uniref:RING finger domain-containing protein n=1 Tax=Paraburkholderia sp. J67 TaxID=2805435 RepID=UPI002ABD9CEA|nr:RING finger domain-containing protein [Paraburkholderia sp. J67]